MDNKKTTNRSRIGEYTKLIIQENTLVPKGAVGVKGIYKSEDGALNKIKTVITKADDEKMELHSIMYLLNEKDSHGNFVSNPKVLEDACVDFMKNGDKTVRWTHNGEKVEASVMQLYIVPEGHPIWGEKKYVNALANVIKFTDIELYNYCKANDFETSIGGQAEEVSEESDENGNINKNITDKNKERVDMEDNQETLDRFYNLSNTISNILYGDTTETVEEKLAKMKVAIEAFSPATSTDTDKAKEPEVDSKEPTEDIKKELDVEVTTFITSTVEAAIAPLLAQIEELKKLIPSDVQTQIEEIKKGYEKELKEIKKEIVLSIDNSGAVAPVKSVKKTALS